MHFEMVVDVCSPPDRQNLVASISCNCEQWAEIHQEADILTLEIYPRQDGKPWELSFDQAMTALRQAKTRLTGIDIPGAEGLT
jgi:hypothetical protein